MNNYGWTINRIHRYFKQNFIYFHIQKQKHIFIINKIYSLIYKWSWLLTDSTTLNCYTRLNELLISTKPSLSDSLLDLVTLITMLNRVIIYELCIEYKINNLEASNRLDIFTKISRALTV